VRRSVGSDPTVPQVHAHFASDLIKAILFPNLNEAGRRVYVFFFQYTRTIVADAQLQRPALFVAQSVVDSSNFMMVTRRKCRVQ